MHNASLWQLVAAPTRNRELFRSFRIAQGLIELPHRDKKLRVAIGEDNRPTLSVPLLVVVREILVLRAIAVKWRRKPRKHLVTHNPCVCRLYKLCKRYDCISGLYNVVLHTKTGDFTKCSTGKSIA